MDNQLTVINYSAPEVVRTLKATVANGLTDPEFMLFVEHCKGTGLNPFKKEVWAIKAGGRLQLMTGNQGFHAIANTHPQYDGMETGFVGSEGQHLPMTYPHNDFIGAWCKVYRKDRRVPIEAVAMLEEYDKGQSNWKTMRRIMIVKCAESLALRKSFPQELNGMYTAEEMPAEYSTPKEVPVYGTTKPVAPAPSMQEAKDLLLGDQPSGILDADVPPPSNKTYAPVDFTKFKYRYHLPVKKEGVDMDEVRAWLKKKGFRFNGEDKHWYGNHLVEKIQEYLRPLPTTQEEAQFSYGDDDIPSEYTTQSEE